MPNLAMSFVRSPLRKVTEEGVSGGGEGRGEGRGRGSILVGLCMKGTGVKLTGTGVKLTGLVPMGSQRVGVTM